MPARTGDQYLAHLSATQRDLWLEGEQVLDVPAHPKLRGAALTIAAVFDRQHEFASECLVADPETGEDMNISHMIPKSREDLARRVDGLSRISEMTVGLMGRTPDYMNIKFASFAARWRDWAGEGGCNDAGGGDGGAEQTVAAHAWLLGRRARIYSPPSGV